MRKDNNKVEIMEPPLMRLGKTKSCLSRICLSGCGCAIVFVIIFLLVLKSTSEPRAKEIKTPPDYLSAAVPIYDKENINKIEFTSGKNQGKIIEGLALLPKAIIAPFIVELKKIKETKEAAPAKDADKSYFNWSEFKKIMEEPVVDHRDTYNIEWRNLSAQPSFIYNYYQTELNKQNFSITVSGKNEKINQFTFNKNGIDGVVYIEDDLINRGTDYVLLLIKTPAE